MLRVRREPGRRLCLVAIAGAWKMRGIRATGTA